MGIRKKNRFYVANSVNFAGTYKLGEEDRCKYRSVRMSKTSTGDHGITLIAEYKFVGLIKIMLIVLSIC